MPHTHTRMMRTHTRTRARFLSRAIHQRGRARVERLASLRRKLARPRDVLASGSILHSAHARAASLCATCRLGRRHSR